MEHIDQAGASPLPSVEEIAADLRLFIGRVRSAAGFDDLATPALDRLAAGDHGAVPELIRIGIADVDDERYRLFLELLLPLPLQPGAPWEQLGPNRRSDGRGERAAREAFGLSWDGCNRPGQLLDGRSRRDWAEVLLARSLRGRVAAPSRPMAHSDAPAGPSPEAAGDGVAEVHDAEASPPRPRRRAVLAGVAAVVALVGLVALAAAVRDEGAGRDPRVRVAADTTQVSEPVSCAAVGALSTELEGEPDAEAISAALVDVYQGIRAADAGCPTEPARRWGDLIVQELRQGEKGLAAALVVRRSDGGGMYLPGTAYGRYRQIGAADGSMAQKVGGLPLSMTTHPDGHREILLSRGTLMVSEGADAPYFWVPAAFVEWWRRHPELGLPTGNPLPDLVQDFQGGFASLDPQGAPAPVANVVTDPAAELPALGDLEGKVLRQADATAWWIGPDRRRYWIATGGVWDCLVGDRASSVQAVRGYAVSTLPYGGHAACPTSGD